MIDPTTITTVRVDELPLDSLHLTDLFPFETSDKILKQNTIQALVNFIAPLVSSLQFEIKTLSVSQTYIDSNFDNTGLGINIMVGYAICNGQNGTPNLDGQIEIGYGAVNSNIGGFGGEKTHKLTVNELPSHTHENNGSANDNGDPGQFVITSANNGGENVKVMSSATGLNTAHNNMQPYLVALKIMKL